MQRATCIIRLVTRRAHSKAAASKDGPRIYLSKDETCFVSYHPGAEHPYKYTKPLPKAKVEDESYLKVTATNMITNVPNLEQVQDLTYTHKSHWRNYQGRAKRRLYKSYFDDKIDRKGLTS